MNILLTWFIGFLLSIIVAYIIISELKEEEQLSFSTIAVLFFCGITYLSFSVIPYKSLNHFESGSILVVFVVISMIVAKVIMSIIRNRKKDI